MFKFKIIIPARKGSKRLINKNIRQLGGIPLIQHTIDFALLQIEISHNDIWVNTDCPDIEKIAKNNGLNVYRRPISLGSDHTPTVDVLFDQVNFFFKENISLDYIVLLQPTSPFRPKNILNDAITIINERKVSSLSTFSLLNKKYGKIESDRFYPLNYEPGVRSQDIKAEYFENGLLYITSIKNIISKKIITEDTYPLVVDDKNFILDIDTIHDLNYAQYLILNN